MGDTIVEFNEDMIAEELKSALLETDTICSEEIEEQIDKLDDNILVNVSKKMGPAVEIMKVVEITEDNVLEI